MKSEQNKIQLRTALIERAKKESTNEWAVRFVEVFEVLETSLAKKVAALSAA
jgi:hypothetical protein